MSDENEILWRPTSERRKGSRMRAFAEFLSERGGVGAAAVEGDDYDALHAASLERQDVFWKAAWDFFGVVGEVGERSYVPDSDMRRARYFPDARLNYSENLLETSRPDDETAILSFDEREDSTRRLSRGDLRRRVARLRRYLDSCGVGSESRVAAVMPNVPETVSAFAATASSGATWSSCSPDFGVDGIVSRFGQIEPTALFVCGGYRYGGRFHPLAEKMRDAVASLPSVNDVAVIDFLGGEDETADAISAARPDVRVRRLSDPFDDFALADADADAEIDYVRLPFDHPLYVLFSSGTTGPPKCIEHRAGGALLKHLSEIGLHGDVGAGDRLLFFTTCGWMMWNWLVSGLAAQATIVLYDGNPLHPDASRLLRFAESERLSAFGVSAKFIDAVRKSGVAPRRENYDLSELRSIFSTGSPLSREGFRFVYEGIKEDVHLASISGGTDICGCFVAGNPFGDVRAGEIQCAVLGMDVRVLDPHGEALSSGTGELACGSPFPSMPTGFLNDSDGESYRRAYFDFFPGLWRHGDFVERTSSGGYVMHGRSDATLNPSGVRIGTAEIYAQVETLDEVVEAVAAGYTVDSDVRIVLFVRLSDGVELTSSLESAIRSAIRKGASPRHVPWRIGSVSDIPRTRSGKVSELAVRDAIHGREVLNTEALANAESLSEYRNHSALRS